jgi:hypothetical protein
MREWILGIASSMLLPVLFAPMVVAPPEVVESTQAELNKWPTIQVDAETVPAPIPDPAPDAEPMAEAHSPFCPDQMQTSGMAASNDIDKLKSLSQQILDSADQVKRDAEAAKRYADEAKKAVAESKAFSDGMKSNMSSYWPNPNAEPKSALTEARVIELIDQRIKELKIECKCVQTGKTVTRNVPIAIDSRGVTRFDVQAGEILMGYEDVTTGKWVTVNRNAMTPVQGVTNTVYSHSTPTTEYREIKPTTRSAPVRAAIRFNPLPQGWMQPGPVSGFASPSNCRVVNGVRVCN